MGPPCGLMFWKFRFLLGPGTKNPDPGGKNPVVNPSIFVLPAGRRHPIIGNMQKCICFLQWTFSPSMDVPQEKIGPWIQAHFDGGRDMFVEKLTAFAKELGFSVFWEYPGKSRAWISLRDHVWGWGVQRFCPAWVPWCSMMIPESVFNVLGWLRMALRRFQGELGTPFWWLRSARTSGFSRWIKRFPAVSNGSMMIPGWFLNV